MLKKIFLLSLALVPLGIGLLVLDDRVLESAEDKRLAKFQRLQIGAAAELRPTLGYRSLDGHFQLGDLKAMLDGKTEWPATAAAQKLWGDTLTIRTTTVRDRPVSVNNLHRIDARIHVAVPQDAALLGREGELVLQGVVNYPTAAPGASQFSEESQRFKERIPVLFVATAEEARVPTRPVQTLGNGVLVGGVVALGVAFVLALIRSAGISSASSLARAPQQNPELAAAIEQGGRFVVFPYAFSVVVLTFRNGSDVYYIPPGESSFFPGLKWIMLSLTFGWWGIPWGPIYTLGSLGTNFTGGRDVTRTVVEQMTRPAAPQPPPLPTAPGGASPVAFAVDSTKPPPLPPPAPPR